MRLRYAVVGVVFASSLGGVAYGCGGGDSTQPIENLCGWIDDPANCLRSFYLDVGAQCGKAGSDKNTPIGAFANRAMLDICVLEGGGQVAFDGLDISQFPIGVPQINIADGGVAPAGPVGFTISKPNGDQCANGSFTSNETWSITIDGCPPDAGAPPPFVGASGAGGNLPGVGGGGGAGGAGGMMAGAGGGIPASAGCNRGGIGAGGGSVTIIGGTFSMTETGDLIDVSCPNGEGHHFDQLTEAKCPKAAPLVPYAEMQSYAGDVNHEGYVWFRVHYPPGTSVPDGSTDLEGRSEEVVNYFFCEIPKAPRQCMDGLKDGAESDVDCGGPEDPSLMGCPGRCMMGQACFMTSDCLVGAMCLPDPMSGFKKCVGGPPPTSSSSSGSGSGGAGAGGGGGGGGSAMSSSSTG